MVQTASTMAPLGMEAPSFSLPEPATDRIVSLTDFDGSAGLLVIFLSNHCPFVKHVRSGLAEFVREYQEKGLAVVGIGANDAEGYPDDAPAKIAEEVEKVGYTFPYLYDESQEVAKRYTAACTPDFFLFDGGRRLVYRGQFDGSRPSNDVPVTGVDLRAAVDAILGGEKPDPENQIPSLGCNIKWRRGNEPDYFG
jgi:peroxiredoxin